MTELPETILQFGGGNFLRAFFDLFVEQANRSGQAVGRIVVVQSTESGVADTINAQGGRYHALIRGIRNGRRVDEVEPVRSVSRALFARTQWTQVLNVARSPELRYIVSNTTEAGFALDAADVERPAGATPASFPAKLLDLLWARFQADRSTPVTILPCELLPKNGDRLRELVTLQAQRWNAPPDLFDWIDTHCQWANSLVDRIVSGKPAAHSLLATDALLTVAEPYALWAIESQPGLSLFSHPAIEVVADIAPYELRKIRMLNGAHTALVAYAMPMGLVTVREALKHPVVGSWLKQLLEHEIVPTITDRIPDATGFMHATLDRFANPFLEHKLSAIALNHAAKLKIRLASTRDEFVTTFGHAPPILTGLLENSATV